MVKKDDGEISKFLKLLWDKIDFTDFNLNRYEDKSLLDITRSIFCGGAAFFLGVAAGFATGFFGFVAAGLGATPGCAPLAVAVGALSMGFAALSLTSALYDLKVCYQSTAYLADKTIVAAANQFILKEPTTFGDFVRNSMNFFVSFAGIKLCEKPIKPSEDIYVPRTSPPI